MPDMTIEIGGRAFTVTCQDGEEAYLTSAAELLDREAQALLASGVRLPQDRMLLMAGLMLADKSISAEEELRSMDRRLAQQSKMLDELNARPAPEPVEVVREVMPEGALSRLSTLAEKAEAVAALASERSDG